MDLELNFHKIPYLYHLTDEGNIKNILKEKELLSTKTIVNRSELKNKKLFLTTRRKEHVEIISDGVRYRIRDQKPLNKALDKCLTNGYTREDYIYLLNKRVFFWPNTKRLGVHYERYKKENPAIIKISSEELFKLNSENIEVTHLNSGATRPLPKYNGKAPPRGKDTFISITKFDKDWKNIAEVTVLDRCLLPDVVFISNHPDGEWNRL